MKIHVTPYIEQIFSFLGTCTLLSLISLQSACATSIATVGSTTRVDHNGTIYEVDANGSVFRLNNNNRVQVDQLYDPNFVSKSYKQENGSIYRIVPGYGDFPVQRSFTEGFEEANDIHQLIGPAYNWTSMTLQGPASKKVEDYVKLRSEILKKKTDFIDNRIDISFVRSKSGNKSVRFYAVKPTPDMDITKTSLDTELVFFRKGDNFRFTGWFYLESGNPISIIDLESTYMKEAPGIRLMLDDELKPSVELKFATKPTYYMDNATAYTFPKNKWVKVELALFLSDDENGKIELWMDDQKVIDETGRTMTLHDAIYNSLQVGITANPENTETVLFLDDVTLSDQ